MCVCDAVQFCGTHPGTSWHDGKAAGTGDGLQDYGARQWLNEGPEEGRCTSQ